MKGECTRGKECDFWHPPKCKHFKAGACSLGKECCFVHTESTKSNSGTDAASKTKAEAKDKTKSQAKGKANPAVLMALVATTLAGAGESLFVNSYFPALPSIISSPSKQNGSSADYACIGVSFDYEATKESIRHNKNPSRCTARAQYQIQSGKPPHTDLSDPDVLDGDLKRAKYNAMKLRKEVTGKMPDSTTFFIYYKEKNEVESSKQNVSPAEGKQSPKQNVSPAEGKQSHKQNVSPAEGKQSHKQNVSPAEGKQSPKQNVSPAEGNQKLQSPERIILRLPSAVGTKSPRNLHSRQWSLLPHAVICGIDGS